MSSPHDLDHRLRQMRDYLAKGVSCRASLQVVNAADQPRLAGCLRSIESKLADVAKVHSQPIADEKLHWVIDVLPKVKS